MGTLLAVRDGISWDDLALIVFFAIVAILKLIQKALQKKAPAEERRPPGEEPAEDARHRHRERPTIPSRAPTSAPVASHLASLEGIARGTRADLSQRHAEPPARAAARVSGRTLLLARDLPPADRLRQAMVWAEVLRPHRPLRPPARRRPPSS
jgi:hypothetical protein